MPLCSYLPDIPLSRHCYAMDSISVLSLHVLRPVVDLQFDTLVEKANVIVLTEECASFYEITLYI